LGEMKSEVEKIKIKATSSLNSLDLPPEVKAHTDKLKQSLGSYQIPVTNGNIPNIGVGSQRLPGINLSGAIGTPTMGSTNLPSANVVSSMPQLGSLNDITKGASEITNLTKEAGNYGKDIQNISKGNLADAKSLEKKAQEELKNVEGLKEIEGKKGELEKYKNQLAKPDSIALSMAKEQAKEMVIKEATNHFAFEGRHGQDDQPKNQIQRSKEHGGLAEAIAQSV
jgi:hypothetical protein